MKKFSKFPKFRTVAVERKFWSKLKLNDYFVGSDFVRVSFPNLKSSFGFAIRINEQSV